MTEKPIAGAGAIEVGELPGGEVMSTFHLGPYSGLPQAAAALHAWAAKHDREAAGPEWYSYWTDPGAEPDTAKWKTEVILPLKPR